MKRIGVAGPVVAVILSLCTVAPSDAHPVSETGALFLGQYARIHDALASDRTDGVVEAARRMAEVAREMEPHAGAESELYRRVAVAAERFTGGGIAELRAELEELSLAVEALLRAGGVGGWTLYHCAMASAYWIQSGDEVRNPYYGASMLRCGEKVERVSEP